MIRSVIKSARTERDLIEHFANIASDKIEPADRFLRVADESFNLLAQSPFMGLEWESKDRQLRGIRHYPLPSPYRSYIVFYRVNSDSVEIIAVLHGARNLEAVLRDLVE